MNAVEHIVECYFRYVKGCFTMTDVKVSGGNNRQCDLLAYDAKNKKQYHVESSVTHEKTWAPTISKLMDSFDKKFKGEPPKREGKNTDYSKGKSYYSRILDTYRNVGLDPNTIERIFVIWEKVNQKDDFLSAYHKETNLRVQLLSLRDEILPELMNRIATSNYDDEVLRTLSLLRQKTIQDK